MLVEDCIIDQVVLSIHKIIVNWDHVSDCEIGVEGDLFIDTIPFSICWHCGLNANTADS